MNFATIILIIIFIIFMFTLVLFMSNLITTMVLNVPYVPSSKKFVKILLKSYKFDPKNTVADLGCGDGTILFGIRKQYPKLKLIGYEISLLPYLIAKTLNKFKKSNIDIYMKNYLKEDLSNIDTIFVYLFPTAMEKLYNHLKTFNKKFTIISRAFKLKGVKETQVIKEGKYKIFIYKI